MIDIAINQSLIKYPYLLSLLEKEEQRQRDNIELIASENFCSDAVRAAMASCLTNKYAEGYPGNRYYGGCQYIDEIENECKLIWQKVFNTDYAVNVQPHSGSQANASAYAAVLNPGDTILAMDLNHGGHLTHGSRVNFSGKIYDVQFYGVDKNGYIDFNDLEDKLKKFSPKLVVAGASAYPREIDFEQSAKIAHCYDAKLMVDMAHIAGLVATGEHNSPFGYADIITTTTHKTLRGPRSGMIFCTPELEKKMNSGVFPGNQGGPLEHVILAKAICGEEALSEEYKKYIRNVKINANIMAEEFKNLGYELVTGGTDNHLMLLDFKRTHPLITGLAVQEELDKHNITLNKNCVPDDPRSPKYTSGVRIGTPAMTTKGWDAHDFRDCAKLIDEIIRKI